MNRLGHYLASLRHSLHLKFRLANAISGLLPDFASGMVRGRLYRLVGLEIGRGAFIMGNLDLISGRPRMYEKLVIGRGSVVGNRVTINVDAPVRLGKNVSIGPNVLIYTGSHTIGPGSNRRVGDVVGRPVTIEDGSWVGLAAVILPGVTVGRGSVVAAGAVVSEDVPPHTYVEGNPARVVHQLPWADR